MKTASKKIPKLKKGYDRIWITPTEYHDSDSRESPEKFEGRTGIEWYLDGRYSKIEWNFGCSEFYLGKKEISEEQYNEYWTRKLIIKAIKGL